MIPEIPGLTTGELEKMKILSFDKPGRKGKPLKEFEVMFNPNAYSDKFTTSFYELTAQGNSSGKPVFGNNRSNTHTFEFLIDATGISGPLAALGVAISIPGIGNLLEPTSVEDKVKEFLECTFYVVKEIHRPPFLLISWGKFSSSCVLQSADVNYSLFKPSGIPLRAKINATFLEDNRETIEQQSNNRSPDLTRIQIVQEEDNLPLLSKKSYNDSAYYLQVARRNKLKHFRRLQTGHELSFPPLRNQSTKNS